MNQQLWLYFLVVILGGAIAKELFANPFMLVVIDLAILLILYLILSRYPFVDIKKSMYFLSFLTFITILVDVNIVPGILGNIVILGLLLWMIFGRNNGNGPKRPPLRHKWHK